MIGREEERPGGNPFPVAGRELGAIAAKISSYNQNGRWISARFEFRLVKKPRLERKGFGQRAVGHHRPYQHPLWAQTGGDNNQGRLADGDVLPAAGVEGLGGGRSLEGVILTLLRPSHIVEGGDAWEGALRVTAASTLFCASPGRVIVPVLPLAVFTLTAIPGTWLA